MAIITFYGENNKETGNTVAAIALGTFFGITQNKKTLIMSTSLNDNTIEQSLWGEQKKSGGFFRSRESVLVQNGIGELDRIVRSNKLAPEIITNYSKVALKGRLDVITSYNGTNEQYVDIQQDFSKIISAAGNYYDNVIVDLDKRLMTKSKLEILEITDVVVAVTRQRASDINDLIGQMQKGGILKKENTVIALGRYDDKSKYNAKNITRSLIRQKNIVNTIPYNTLVFEALQEGKIIDIFWQFLNLKNKDENYNFIQEIKRLSESINEKVIEEQMNRSGLR